MVEFPRELNISNTFNVEDLFPYQPLDATPEVIIEQSSNLGQFSKGLDGVDIAAAAMPLM